MLCGGCLPPLPVAIALGSVSFKMEPLCEKDSDLGTTVDDILDLTCDEDPCQQKCPDDPVCSDDLDCTTWPCSDGCPSDRECEEVIDCFDDPCHELCQPNSDCTAD